MKNVLLQKLHTSFHCINIHIKATKNKKKIEMSELIGQTLKVQEMFTSSGLEFQYYCQKILKNASS